MSNIDKCKYIFHNLTYFLSRGAVLIFLPGLAEIEKLINLLSDDSTANQ